VFNDIRCEIVFGNSQKWARKKRSIVQFFDKLFIILHAGTTFHAKVLRAKLLREKLLCRAKRAKYLPSILIRKVFQAKVSLRETFA